jgi:hypothetical protein
LSSKIPQANKKCNDDEKGKKSSSRQKCHAMHAFPGGGVEACSYLSSLGVSRHTIMLRAPNYVLIYRISEFRID